MKVSVIAGLIVAVHVLVAVVVVTPGCMAQRGGNEPGLASEVLPPDIPVMPPTIETEPVVADPVVVPPVVEPVDVPAPAPAVDNVYVIQNGDSLSKIAARHGVKTAELAELNNIADANKIRVGQKIVLPAYAKASTSAPKAPAAEKPAAPAKVEVAADGIYVVKNGDALSKIAKAHGVKQSEIMALNGIKDANKIRIGQKLKMPVAGAPAAAAPEAAKPAEKAAAEAPVVEVPAAEAPAVSPMPAAAEIPSVEILAADASADLLAYTVNEGDTVESIGHLFGVPSDVIRSLNSLDAGAQVQAGQTIRIPPYP